MTPKGSVTDQPLPSFLSAGNGKQQDVGTTWEAAAVSSRILKLSILAAAVALLGIVALQAFYPVTRVPKFMSPLTDMSAGQRDLSPFTPTTRPAAEAEVSASVAADRPARDEIAPAPQPTAQMQPEGNELSNDALFAQFQTWAARQPSRPLPEPPPLELDAPAPIAVDTPMAALPLQKPKKPKAVQNAQADATHIPIPRARMQWGQVAHVEGKPAPGSRTSDQAAQNSTTPSWLQSLSSH
jgi:hypothetical protein